MTVQKKRGRPAKTITVSTEMPKRRGRPAGTRKKHAPTVESVRNEWEKRYNELLGVKEAARQEIISLSVEIAKTERELNQLKESANHHIRTLEKQAETSKVRELKLFGIIEYLEDKVKNAIKADSI